MPDGTAQVAAARQQANVANRRRYQQLLRYMGQLRRQVITGGYGAASRLLSRMGAAGRTRIGETFARERATAEQDLISRGLGGTTVRSAVQRGLATAEEQSIQELQERMYGQRAGLLERRAGAEMQLGGMRAGIMEGRADVGPDVGMYANLMRAASAAGGDTGRATLTIPPPSNWQAGGGPMSRWAAQGAAAVAGGGGGGLSPSGGISGAGAAAGGGPAQLFRGGAAGGGVAAAGSPGADMVQGAGMSTTDVLGPGGMFAGGMGFYGAGEQPGFVSGAGETAPEGLPEEAMVSTGRADILGMARGLAGPEAAAKIGPEGGAKMSFGKWRLSRVRKGILGSTREQYNAYLKGQR